VVNSVGIGHWERFLENNWCTILRSMQLEMPNANFH
jgi:hypothetical protein